jgi:hypothetical protein
MKGDPSKWSTLSLEKEEREQQNLSCEVKDK